uniref:Uncharacterized protein n=1 Tax=Fagus sylvatica TaxID=28930 RepID=A0A2N9HKT5_FAGSY
MEEVAISENERGGNRLPTFNHRRIQSEVRVPGGQREREVQHSCGRTEGRQRSHSKEPSFLGEARKKRRIEELEEELKLLKRGNERKDEQHQRRRTRSHSGLCESSHRVRSRKERSERSDHKPQRTVSPKRRRHDHPKTPPPQPEHNPIWKKLQQISLSPFSSKIERAKFPAKFTSPNLAVYDGKSDPVGHLSRYRQAMALHNSNDALMCRIFPSSLGEVGLRWFDRLEHESIRSWKEMSQVFTARFITNTRKPKEIDSLLALTMKDGETLKSYSTRYWEIYNDIDACDEDIVVKTFQFGLHQDSKLKKSFAKRPPVSMADLMTHLEQHIRVEDDSKSSTKAAEVAPLADIKATQPEPRRTKRSKSSTNPPGTGLCLAVYTTFKEPIYRLLPLIKDKPYFEWPQKMPGDPATRENKPYCSYHRERRHLTEQCRAYKYHLEHLVKNGHLKQYVDESKNPHQTIKAPRTTVKASAPVGIIDVIHYGTIGHDQKGEMRRTAHLQEIFQIGGSAQMAPVPLKKESAEHIVFDDQDLEGVQLPHSDALVITLRIGEFDVKRILIDPGSSIEIMYESLFRGLGLGEERSEPALKDCSVASLERQSFHPESSLHTPSTAKVSDTTRCHGNHGGPTGGKTPYEASGVDSEFVCHELNVSPEYKPVVQKARRTVPQHAEAVREEVDRLLKIGTIKEVLSEQSLPERSFPTPKDPFPLLKIDQLVDSTAGHERMSFLDAFQGYHQIALKREDQEKTAFITPRGVFCYKNQEHGPHGRLEAGLQHTQKEQLETQRLKMCIWSSPLRQSEKFKRLTGMAAALNRFISKSAEKCRPFFDLIKKGKNFAWSEESDRAFERLKEYLSSSLLLSSPKEEEPLYIYLAATDKAVSAAIVRDDSGKQRPVYYTSKTMNAAETRYLPLEKSALALFVTSKKLPHYFQAHTMIVLTSLPLKALFKSSDFSSRISKWGAHLGAYNVRYKSRTTIKAQVLADFIAEFTPENNNMLNKEEHPKDAERNLGNKGWMLYVDGAANSRGSGLGIVLISPGGELLEQTIRLGFGASNNEAEYEALLHGLRAARRLGADPLTIYCDSQLIANQFTGEYMAKDERMIAYLDLAKNLLRGFREFNIERVGQEHNGHADSLAGLASSVVPDFRRTITVEVQDFPSIAENSQESICQIETRPSWMDPILDYLSKDILQADQKEAAKVHKTITRYWVSREGKLYKKSFTGPYLLCVHPDLVQNLLYEIHEGVCGAHTGGRSLAHRAIGQGYWWPYMQKDAAQYVRRCEKCQLFAPAIHKPASQLNPISSPWPFAQWGLDLVGPLPRATGNRQWLIVATDYFTKWVEAEPLARITDSESRKFIWKNIITRFGIP